MGVTSAIRNASGNGAISLISDQTVDIDQSQDMLRNHEVLKLESLREVL